MAAFDDDLLDMIARQARMAYASHQIAQCQAEARLWRYRAEHGLAEPTRAQAREELARWSRQLDYWLDYLAQLECKGTTALEMQAA